MTRDAAGTLVPPRPNLGPEPWPESSQRASSQVFVAIGLGVITALLAYGWFLRRRRRFGARPLPVDPEPGDELPHARLLRLVAEVRRTLGTRFGPSMLARTTEELAADATLREALGDDQFDSLIRMLQRSDRRKFAPASMDFEGESLEDDIRTAERLVAGLARIAGR